MDQPEQRERTRDPTQGEDASFDPAATVPALSEEQVSRLAQVGRHWHRVVRHQHPDRVELPVDSDLVVAPSSQRGRYTPVAFASSEEPEKVLQLEPSEPERALPRLGQRLRHAIVGPPLRSAAVAHERMRKLIALPVLASDALSSVAYGPEAIITVLVVAGSSTFGDAIPIGAAIVVLMVAVGLSYRQTVRAYPGGGGSYIVASDNLGELPGLFAAAGLMTDYVLTVAVSIASGVAAVTSAIPGLHSDVVVIGVLVLVLLFAGNVRGIREAGMLFAAPTYLFIAAILTIVVVGLADAAGHGFHVTHPRYVAGTEGLGLLLILRAFSSGATAMTGIEAISDAVPAFQPTAWRNARTTLSWMVGLLVVMFAGVMALIHFDGVEPRRNETILSQLARHALGSGVLYGFVQAATALVLLLAANTAFNDFPRLLYFMARNRHMPALFLRMGDRLAFSNGMLLLAVLAGTVFVAFKGDTQKLIPLYAVGVFLAFTLSQAGMVVRWWRTREGRWRRSITFNAVGCVLSAIVLLISGATKFAEGAWVVVIAVPLLVVLFLRIGGYYRMVRRSIALGPVAEEPAPTVEVPGGPLHAVHDEATEAKPPDEHEQSPEQVRHLALVPVAALDRSTMRALAYAASLGSPVLALHISPNDEEAERFRGYWEVWGNHLPLQIVVSPYRTIVAPLAHYIELLHRQRDGLTLTVVLPEIVPRYAWQRVLHGGIAARLRRALRHEPRIVIASVPFHLPR